MKIKGILDEDCVNFKYPSLYISTCYCDFKCDKENGNAICQNEELAKSKILDIDDCIIIERYLNNKITKAIIFAGLEPLCQFEELYNFINILRKKYNCNDTVVIYTGYNKNEIYNEVLQLKQLENIIIKFGRFIPNQEKHFDEVLGVYLASYNQYAEYL